MQQHEMQQHAQRTPRAAGPDPEAAIQMSVLGELARQGQAAEWSAAMGEAAGDPNDIHALAHEGVAGPGGALPHHDRIQAAFGRFDVSGISAHVGGRTKRAAEGMGASAYATGESVGFADDPDLHRAAHEATHVVQQRAGVSLAGGVGVAGDAHEQHADAVADAVVAGENAEPLLAQYGPEDGGYAAGAGAASSAVQQSPEDEAGALTSTEPPSAFAVAFNRELASVLHAFAPGAGGAGDAVSCEPGDAPAVSGDQAPRSASGVALGDDRLDLLFTPNQQAKLMHYFETGEIPERLFNGDEVGETTAQQRILISAHILAHGHYRPASIEQRVHARMCFHWVHLVHHYAGATPETGPLTNGIMGSTDHTGQIVLGGGDRSQGRQGSRSESPERQERRQDRLEAAQAALAEAEASGTASPAQLLSLQQAVRAAEAAAGRDYIRNAALDLAEIRGLQAGDWIYYHNDNDSRSGDHSVLFSRWLTEERVAPGRGGGEVHYRQAEVFSQGLPETGGQQHTAWLGDGIAQVDGFTVHPVTRYSRVPADSRPAATVDELLPLPANLRTPPPPGSSERQVEAYQRRLEQYTTGLRTQNVRHLRRQLRGQVFDEEQAIAAVEGWLRAQNVALIGQLEARTTAGQRALMAEANAEGQPLESLVRLNERLRGLGTNVALGEEGTAGETARFEARYSEGIAKWRAAVHKALDQLDRRLDGAGAALTALEPDLSPATPLTRALVEEGLIAEIRGDIGLLRQNDPDATPEAEQDLLGLIDGDLTRLQPQLLPVRRELARGRNRPASWGSARQPLNLLDTRIGLYRREIRDANRQTPYVMAHAGATHRDADNKTSGLLENVPGIPWSALVRPVVGGGGAPPS